MHEVLSGFTLTTVLTQTCIAVIVAILAHVLIVTLPSCELLFASIADRRIIQIKQEASFTHLENGCVLAALFVRRLPIGAGRTFHIHWCRGVHGVLDVVVAALAQRVGNSVATDELERGGCVIAAVAESRHLVFREREFGVRYSCGHTGLRPGTEQIRFGGFRHRPGNGKDLFSHITYTHLPLLTLRQFNIILIERLLILAKPCKLAAHSFIVNIIQLTQAVVEPIAEHLKLDLFSEILVKLYRSEHPIRIIHSVNGPTFDVSCLEDIVVLLAELRIHNREHMEPREVKDRVADFVGGLGSVGIHPLQRGSMELRMVGVGPVLGGDTAIENGLACEGVLDQVELVSSLVGEGLRDLVSAYDAEGLGGIFADERAVAEGGHLC